MNYPIWDTGFFSGGSLIALISVPHVYIAHFAVGGGLFLWLTDRKALMEGNALLDDYLRAHNWFFLLLTMVFGGVSGVGIWFILGLVSPAAISSLIHNFVFAWGIEWTFFLGEIVALLIYHYHFDTMKRHLRLRVAFLYFVFAWMSLFVVNGILSFMLTPGAWIKSRDFWDGFLNPGFAPSTLFRSFAAFMFAGLFGYVTTVRMEEGEFRTRMMRYCTKWLLYPMIGLAISGAWYFYAVPAATRHTAFAVNPEMGPYVCTIVVASILIFAGGLALSLRSGRVLQKSITAVLILIGLSWMGGFEYVREISRKPHVISEYMYSTSISVLDEERLNREGVLPNARWSSVHSLTADNAMEAGRELYRIQCSPCHTAGGIRNDIIPRTRAFTYLGMLSQLTGQGRVKPYMPRFAGTEAEKRALAEYIVAGLNGQTLEARPEPKAIRHLPDSAPLQFDSKNDNYVLLAWSGSGMHFVSDSDPWFVILPPAAGLEALLIRRGGTPEPVSEKVVINYRVEPGFESPSRHSLFWDYAEKYFNTKPAPDKGLLGNGTSGELAYNDKIMSFAADGIPILPYTDVGTFNPYPLFTITAKDSASGKVLASTRTVLPVSTEMGCRNCHGGPWRWKNISGIADDTAHDILRRHDRAHGTDLMASAVKGKPRLCQSCHADPAINAVGDGKRLPLSASIHGLHANYIPVKGADACGLCHPSHKNGATRYARGLHASVGLSCVNCHGSMSDHAISLLRFEEGKRSAASLIKHLQPVAVQARADIKPRKPWINGPDCLACHVDFKKPSDNPSAFNKWTGEAADLYKNRTDDTGSLRCVACHGTAHAEYPARNPYNARRDSLQPLQYGKTPYAIGANRGCETCHREAKRDEVHHRNMLRMVRRTVRQ
ncbi:MAG TPA: c-type cytochrome [Spirochaetota bacterium]|nr:c-type cytochrome [Spirochaetota bacterium]HPV96648.1 c-type cytochrome [Spirochaetota bacterium]